MVLLDTAQHFAQETKTQIACAHFNHCLRGAEAERDAYFVQTFCEMKGIPFLLGTGDVTAAAAQRGMGIEETARNLRYAFLHEAADQLSCQWIATAHNVALHFRN